MAKTTDKTPKKTEAKKDAKTKGIKKIQQKISGAEKTKYKITWKTLAWAIAMLLWVYIVLNASGLIIGFIMIGILGAETIMQPVWSTVYSALVYILCLFLATFVPWKILKMKTNRDELGLTGLPTWTDIGLAPVGFVVYLVLSMIAIPLLPNINWEQTQDVGFQNLILASDKILAFIALVVVAPIAEEIIFRGWLYGKLRAKIPAWLSILLVSILFGIMHGQWNVAVNVFCMSVVMCLLREITGTIWSGMLLHIVKNAVAFYALFINPMIS